MRRRPGPLRATTALAIAATLVAMIATAAIARARDTRVAPGRAAEVLAAAAPGDTITLAAGVHRGPLRVARAVTLRGVRGAMLHGGGQGSVLEITASGVTVEDLMLRGSGHRVLTVDAAIHVVRASEVTLRRLGVSDVLYGVHAERADRLTIEDCVVTGRVQPGDENGAGNGVHLWYSADAVVRRVTVRRFLDAIYLSFADRARIERCVLEDAGRYGLHTMYCQGGLVRESISRRNVAGCAIMFSNHLRLERNEFSLNRGPRTYGVLLRDCSDGVFTGNRLVANTIAVFMDNSNRNRLRDNLVQDNGWGVLLFSSCRGNVFASNTFLHNDVPVALDMRYSDNAFDDGHTGNYWSDHAAYDLDGDGVSDVPYTPVTAFAFVSKQVPDLGILAHSPAVAALGVAERVLPALRPSEAVDRFPLVAPPQATAGPATAGAPSASGPARAAAAGFLGLALAPFLAWWRAFAATRAWRRAGAAR